MSSDFKKKKKEEKSYSLLFFFSYSLLLRAIPSRIYYSPKCVYIHNNSSKSIMQGNSPKRRNIQSHSYIWRCQHVSLSS